MKKGPVKAALFDLDGTLIDTESMYAAAVQRVITELSGNANITYDWLVREKVMGASRIDGSKAIVDAYGLRVTPDELLARRDAYLVRWFPDSVPMPGAQELTHTLKHTLGLKVAVATSSKRALYNIKVAKHAARFDQDVDTTVTGDDPRVKAGKPSPDIFYTAASDLGVFPAECVVFEDSVNGVKAGLAAGAALVVGIPDPHIRPKMEALAAPNLLIINSLSEFDVSMLMQRGQKHCSTHKT